MQTNEKDFSKKNSRKKVKSLAVDVENKLKEALTLFQSGKTNQSQQILSELTSSSNAPAFAWFLSAIIYAQQANNLPAVNAFRKAILTQPIYPDAHNNLGVVLEAIGDIKAAEEHYAKAIQQHPDYISAVFNLGNIHHKQNNYLKAKKYYKQVLELDPKHIKALNNLGLLCQQEKQLVVATEYFERALILSPNDFEILNNTGYTHHLLGRDEQALEYYKKADKISPQNASIHNNIAIVLQSLERYDEAEANFKKAIDLKKDYSEALANLANLYKQREQIDLARDYYTAALKVNPLSPAANNNYGLMRHRDGDYNGAKSHFEMAIKGDEKYSEARYNLGVNQLATGNLLDGWDNYTFRPTTRHHLAMDANSLKNVKLKGKRILLLNEQGIGDELFFLRFCRQLRSLDTTIDYLTTPKIASLLHQITELDRVIESEDQITAYDLAISIADLPAIILDERQSIPSTIILQPNTIQFASLENEIINELKKHGPPPYIGLTWRGGQMEKNLLFKSVPIEQLLNSLENIDATFISLQRKPDSEELKQINNNPNIGSIADFSHYNDDLNRMLSLLTILDDYIGVSNTNMHLRLAVQKTAKVLIPHPPEWRWMLSGDTSPWFPGFTVFRQLPGGDWESGLSKLTKGLIKEYERRT